MRTQLLFIFSDFIEVNIYSCLFCSALCQQIPANVTLWAFKFQYFVWGFFVFSDIFDIFSYGEQLC